MKTRLLAVACLALGACTATRPAMGPANVVDDFQAALVAGDIGRAAAHLDPRVVILESGGAEHSREEYLAGHAQADSEFLRAATINPGLRTVRVEGSTAWVASESLLELERDGEPVTVGSAETMVLARGAGGWRIVHIHWSSRTEE
jgi:ketosteroid isomerase-like protein